jgi:hypothetical protein
MSRHQRKQPIVAGLIVSSVLLRAGALAAQAPVYTAEFLGEAINAAAMNGSARVVGTTEAGLVLRGWVAGPSAPLALLPLPPGYASSAAEDINDAGVIVGAVSTFDSTEFGAEAAAWVPGAGGYDIQLLGKLPGHQTSRATALNDVGDIVGHSVKNSFRSPVLFSAPGGVQDLSATGIFDPVSINDQRVLVDSSFITRRLDLDTLVAESLGLPAEPPAWLATDAEEINAWGQVAGLAIIATSTACNRVAARFTDGIGWQVFSGCGSSNGAYDINVHGDVVMKLNVAPYVRFEGLGTFRIEDLIVADVGHWFVINGFGLTIDDARRMVVPASNSVTGEGGLILLTPQGFLCQADLGSSGPGATELSVCGGDLSSGTAADLHLTGAVPGAAALLVAGLTAAPTPFKGGLLVPVPVLAAVALPVDAGGHAQLPDVPGGGGPLSLYVQAVSTDAAQPAGFALSNALRLDLLP